MAQDYYLSLRLFPHRRCVANAIKMRCKISGNEFTSLRRTRFALRSR